MSSPSPCQPPAPAVAAAGAILILSHVLAPPPLAAQDHASDPGGASFSVWGVELRGGASSPKGELGDINDDGVLLGSGIGVRILPRLEVRGEVTFENLERGGRPSRLQGSRGPQTHLLHYTGVLQLELTDPAATRFEISVLGGAGGTYVSVEDGPAAVPDYSGHMFTVQTGGQVGYAVSESLAFFLRGQVYGLLGDHASAPSYLGTEYVLTHEAGLRVRF